MKDYKRPAQVNRVSQGVQSETGLGRYAEAETYGGFIDHTEELIFVLRVTGNY